MSASMSRAVMLLASIMMANGYLLRQSGPPLHGKVDAAPSGSKAAKKVTPPANNSAKTELAENDKLKKLQFGLETLKNLRTQFSDKVDNDDGSKFAYGALSEELGKKDSGIWSTLTDMLSTTAEAMKQMNGKDKNGQENLMADLEKKLDNKAGRIMNLTQAASKKQQDQDEEYLLGLLNMHREWSLDQQLNATATFMKYSPVIEQLYRHHDAHSPLATQLATLMDAEHAKKKKTTALLLQLMDFIHN
mmetsp:Transcript_74545/g.187747  ORF Transcript_74545/g.187747 Transcript_74545/m.187747 type:complete len:247 (+) Transcript_74545:48-788(+)|eukprot:CAMPEP_0115247472 /NCGR_PEP_ID=MMETSP0270-20121206/41568_1 /TAXON_ID=71861 /ORGANISM="Scrippsiella trochoidea, Strain CCMP3099" /LENGTH=246 /DNA_ID=CAMNT_0002662735 /DNA_START=42 /DNA_END=782 /DNA_ORIENTATION=-